MQRLKFLASQQRNVLNFSRISNDEKH